MGQKLYFSCIRYVDGLVGNSSSGIYETAQFKKGVINIGNRQTGRIQNNNILNCNTQIFSIKKALKQLYSTKFQQKLKTSTDIFKKTYTVNNIYKKIKDLKIPKDYYKEFYDI